MLDHILIFALFRLFTVTEGIREAYYYHIASKLGYNKNLHPLYFIQRGFVFAIIFLLKHSYLEVISFMFMFSFLHDGAYYITRDILQPGVYPKRFMANSTTSTAFIELTFIQRTFAFIVGVVLLIITLIYFP